MPKLSDIVRNRADVTVEVLGADGETKIPVTVTYRPRLMTRAFREELQGYMTVLLKAQQAADAATEAGDAAAFEAAQNDPETDKALDGMSKGMLSLIDGWDLEDDVEDEGGVVRTVAVPFPTTSEEIKEFVAPDLFQAVMAAVMGALNPNRTPDEPSTTGSSGTSPTHEALTPSTPNGAASSRKQRV